MTGLAEFGLVKFFPFFELSVKHIRFFEYTGRSSYRRRSVDFSLSQMASGALDALPFRSGFPRTVFRGIPTQSNKPCRFRFGIRAMTVPTIFGAMLSYTRQLPKKARAYGPGVKSRFPRTELFGMAASTSCRIRFEGKRALGFEGEYPMPLVKFLSPADD